MLGIETMFLLKQRLCQVLGTKKGHKCPFLADQITTTVQKVFYCTIIVINEPVLLLTAPTEPELGGT